MAKSNKLEIGRLEQIIKGQREVLQTAHKRLNALERVCRLAQVPEALIINPQLIEPQPLTLADIEWVESKIKTMH